MNTTTLHETTAPYSLEDARTAESRLLLHTYDRYPIVLDHGEGVYLFDTEGHRFLDLLSGIGVSALGYNHLALTAALATQAAKLIHTSNLFFHQGTVDLALRLTQLTGLDRVFFTNSGTEAWEAALKLARAHARLLTSEGKPLGTKILACADSFHGRTMGSVSTTHKLAYRDPFAPLVPGVEFVPFNDVAALRAAFAVSPQAFCAIAFETVQGEGGIHPASEAFLLAARELCDSTGALLLLDEIQCGMGRTGKWCAYQHTAVTPDVTTLAKPLAGGMPIGAMLCTDRAARAFTPGMHGTTFGGNPLACAAALAVLDTLERDNLLAHVTAAGDYFFNLLHTLAARHAGIVEVRGQGLMIGIELRSADLAKAVLDGMLARRILLNRTHETVLRLLPPFVIEREHADEFVAALDALLTEHAPNAGSVPAGESLHA